MLVPLLLTDALTVSHCGGERLVSVNVLRIHGDGGFLGGPQVLLKGDLSSSETDRK